MLLNYSTYISFIQYQYSTFSRVYTIVTPGYYRSTPTLSSSQPESVNCVAFPPPYAVKIKLEPGEKMQLIMVRRSSSVAHVAT